MPKRQPEDAKPADDKKPDQPPAKKKRKRADLIFAKQEGATLVKKPGDLEGSMFKINDLKNCKVFVFDHTSQMTIDRCEDCVFVLGPIKASLFVRDSKNCDITVSCGQFRCRDLYDSTIRLYCPNDPIIESSAGLTMSPYNLKWHPLESQSNEAELLGEFADDDGVVHRKVNKWREVYDFTTGEAPNYKVIKKAEFKIVQFTTLANRYGLGADVRQLVKDGDFLYELPVEFGGTLDHATVSAQKKDQGLAAFDIKKGPEVARKQLEAQAPKEAPKSEKKPDNTDNLADNWGLNDHQQLNEDNMLQARNASGQKDLLG